MLLPTSGVRPAGSQSTLLLPLTLFPHLSTTTTTTTRPLVPRNNPPSDLPASHSNTLLLVHLLLLSTIIVMLGFFFYFSRRKLNCYRRPRRPASRLGSAGGAFKQVTRQVHPMWPLRLDGGALARGACVRLLLQEGKSHRAHTYRVWRLLPAPGLHAFTRGLQRSVPSNPPRSSGRFIPSHN